jgi:RNA polymerase sigma-54 factor
MPGGRAEQVLILGWEASVYIDQRPVVAPQQTHTVSPKLIESIAILQLSALELEQAVGAEQAENPALEVDEVAQCMQCGTPLVAGRCAVCGPSLAANGRDSLAEWSDLADHAHLGDDDDDFDPMLRVASGMTLEESLLTALRTVLPAEDMLIAEALVGSLDERGYLVARLDELADDLGVPVARVQAALEVLQAQEPLGIGARDVAECLLLQLRWFRDQGDPQPLAEQIVARFLPDVGQRRFVEIGRELGTTSTHVKRAWHFIKTNLNPYPAHVALDDPPTRGSNGRGTTALVRPDVIIRRTETGFEAEVVERRRYRFAINPSFHQVAATKDQPDVSDAQRKHVRHYVHRAQSFIDNVNQRWQTLKRIADALIEAQYDFLDKGVRYLRPLTRSELALYVGLHEATISRATNDKYVLLPEGRTIPFDDFFDGSLRAKDLMRELIAAEDPCHPLSDEDLAALLCERGIPVARRTVAKYREALKILPSRLR